MRKRRACITYIDLLGRVAAVAIVLGAQLCLAYVSVAPGDDAGDTVGMYAPVLCASTRRTPASFRVRLLSWACVSQAVFLYRCACFDIIRGPYGALDNYAGEAGGIYVAGPRAGKIGTDA